MNRPEPKDDEGLTPEQQRFIEQLLHRVPNASPLSRASTWIARRHRDFDMTDQYGDA
jgi:hypothetical protein